MDNLTKTTPKDFFLYAFAAGALYFSATTLITLLWQLINHWLPDASAFDIYAIESVGTALRFAIAMLVIIFPAYLVAMWSIGKDVDRTPEKRELWVRRWFIWATLFIAAVTLLGDLVFLVYTLLGGDVALRFVLKALSVGIVAAAVFVYHWYILHREPGTGMVTRRVITIASAVVVVAAIVLALMVTGSPSSARATINDQQRISDLQNMQYQVTTFWELKQRLPASASELVDPANPMPLPVDPKSQVQYTYEKKGDKEFSLCATFETDMSTDQINMRDSYSTAPYGETGISDTKVWGHGIGETCFTRTIDPERYPQPSTKF